MLYPGLSYAHHLEADEAAPAIKVDGMVIFDGNHRYVAGWLVGKEPAQTAGGLSITWSSCKNSTCAESEN